LYKNSKTISIGSPELAFPAQNKQLCRTKGRIVSPQHIGVTSLPLDSLTLILSAQEREKEVEIAAEFIFSMPFASISYT